MEPTRSGRGPTCPTICAKASPAKLPFNTKAQDLFNTANRFDQR